MVVCLNPSAPNYSVTRYPKKGPMPYAKKEDQLANAKRWREESIKKGYGKALYARRAQRYQNEEILRRGVEEGIRLLKFKQKASALEALDLLKIVLAQAPPVGKPI